MKPRLFSCFLIVFVKFVAPNRSVDCSDEVVNDFYGLSVMTVNLRFLVDDNFVDKRTQNFGREFFITALLMNNVSLILSAALRKFSLRPFPKQLLPVLKEYKRKSISEYVVESEKGELPTV